MKLLFSLDLFLFKTEKSCAHFIQHIIKMGYFLFIFFSKHKIYMYSEKNKHKSNLKLKLHTTYIYIYIYYMYFFHADVAHTGGITQNFE